MTTWVDYVWEKRCGSAMLNYLTCKNEGINEYKQHNFWWCPEKYGNSAVQISWPVQGTDTDSELPVKPPYFFPKNTHRGQESFIHLLVTYFRWTRVKITSGGKKSLNLTGNLDQDLQKKKNPKTTNFSSCYLWSYLWFQMNKLQKGKASIIGLIDI